MPLAPSILGDAPPRDNARFADGARNFVDRVGRHLPGFAGLSVGTLAAIVLMVVVGGFGTGALPLGLRSLFWTLLIGWNAVKWQAWFALTVRRPADWWRAAAFGTVIVNLSLPLEISTVLALCGVRAVMPAATIWIEAVAISAVLFVLVILVRSRAGTTASAPVHSETIVADGLLARAGIADPSALRSIVAEDHYCRVHAGAASALVHYRFGDALDEVASLDGLRVHRGAWVADAAVTGARRVGRRWLLVLSDGRSIAISARYVTAVRARGWLKRRG